MRHDLTFGDWLSAKLWVFMPLTFLFTFAQLPMLLKHGLASEAVTEEEDHPAPDLARPGGDPQKRCGCLACVPDTAP